MLLFIVAALLQTLSIFGVRAPDCSTSRTGSMMHLIVPQASLPIGTPLRVYTLEGECHAEGAYTGPNSHMPIWGYDGIGLASGGFEEGETFVVMAEVEGLEQRVYSNVAEYQDEPFQHFDETYKEDYLIIGDLVSPVLDTARVEWFEQTVNTTPDGRWTIRLQYDSPSPVGAVMLEFHTEGVPAPIIESITPAADTLIVGGTTAAAYIGAGAQLVTFTVSGRGTGGLFLDRVRGTDRSGNRTFVEMPDPPYAAILPAVLVGDLNNDSIVDGRDVRLFFVALVRGTQDSLERADVYPYPNGDGEIDLVDFYYLNVAVVTGTWPDGSSVSP